VTRAVKRLFLCADDYGIAPGVDQAICRLIDLGRLSGTSCITVGRHFEAGVPALRERAAQLEIGLHFTLTNQTPFGPLPRLAPGGRVPTLRRLWRQAFLGGLDRREIGAELARQVQAFEHAFGKPPDFIDSHQHVHLLPAVREIVVGAVGRIVPASTWVRSCLLPPGSRRLGGSPNARARVLHRLSHAFHGLALEQRIGVNEGFLGMYRYGARADYARILEGFLARAEDGTVMMCHPGSVDEELCAVDTLTEGRSVELAILAADDFPGRLARHALRLATPGESQAQQPAMHESPRPAV
jgi:predicted glycoside hydrolase/deacetylase ChbG (UPF0249 family)